jgi:hypothetical protein
VALNEGVERAFYFILGHYVEGKVLFGVVHADLTPRPAYVALAAVGRLLNGAKPTGRVDLGDKKLMAYLFRTEVDGATQETMVAWSQSKPTTVEIRSAEKAFDYLGRELPHARQLELSEAPVFLVLPLGGSKGLKVQPPPATAKRLSVRPSRVILQLIGKGDTNQSAFELDATKKLRLVAYNFGDKPVRGKLGVEGARCPNPEIQIAAGAREERTIVADASGTVTVRFDVGDSAHAIVSGRVFMRSQSPTTIK